MQGQNRRPHLPFLLTSRTWWRGHGSRQGSWEMSQVPTAKQGHRAQRDSRLCPGTRHAPQAFQEGRPGLSIHLEDANRAGESELEVRQGPKWGRAGRRRLPWRLGDNYLEGRGIGSTRASISTTPRVRRGYTVCPEVLVFRLPGKVSSCRGSVGRWCLLKTPSLTPGLVAGSTAPT